VGDAFLIGNPSSSGFATNLSNSTAGFFVGQNLTFTSGAQAGNTAAIAGYTWDATNSVGDVTLGSGLSGAPALGDAFEVGLLSSTQFTTSLTTSYVGQYIVFVSGALIGQEALVTAFNTSTGLMTVAAGLSGAPAYGDSFVVLNFAAGAALVPIATAVGVSGGAAVAPGNTAGLSRVEDLTATGTVTAIQSGLSKPGTAQTITANQNVNVNQWNGGSLPAFPTRFSSLAIDSSGYVTFNNTGIAANNLPTLPTNFASLAITTGGAVTVGTNSDKTGYSLATAPPTAGTIATAVWQDAAAGDFTVSGSAGAALTNAASAAATAASAATAAPNALIAALEAAGLVEAVPGTSSSSGQTEPALQFTPQALAPLEGPGAIAYTITVETTAGVPIQGVSVWITSDAAGNTTIAGSLTTDAAGQAVFLLAAGTYYVWRQLAGYNFTNPQAITVT
jgi:hypothetical protein